MGQPQVGESVADMGCGAGVDVCLAAGFVGREGRVLGLDANPALLKRAQESLLLTRDASLHERIAAPPEGYAPCTFLEASFDDAPHELLRPHLGQYDLVISNGALCLSFNKPGAIRTALGLLRPGGRLQLFDLCVEDGTVPEGLGRWTQKS